MAACFQTKFGHMEYVCACMYVYIYVCIYKYNYIHIYIDMLQVVFSLSVYIFIIIYIVWSVKLPMSDTPMCADAETTNGRICPNLGISAIPQNSNLNRKLRYGRQSDLWVQLVFSNKVRHDTKEKTWPNMVWLVTNKKVEISEIRHQLMLNRENNCVGRKG